MDWSVGDSEVYMYGLSEVRTKDVSVLHEYVYQLSQHAYIVFCMFLLFYTKL